MYIYFSEIPVDQAEEGDYEFEGKNYYYRMEVNSEQFVVRDNCGRYMPFDPSCIGALYKALVYTDAMYTKAKRVEEHYENAIKTYEDFFSELDYSDKEANV